MQIWIDLTNSPHVLFFAGMIRELQQEHEVLLTCRPLANTIELLEMEGFNFYVVGKHYGQSKTRKAFGFLIRIFQLYLFLRNRQVDEAISHSSFYSPVVARLLGIRAIYLNDNEHAAGNRISFLFANQIMIPEFLSVDKAKRQGARPDKIIVYPGVKEGVYLWHYKQALEHEVKRTNIKKKNTIFIRPEPWTAQYYKGKRNFVDDLLIGLREDFELVLLPRGKIQEEYYRQEKFRGIFVPDKSMGLMDIMARCDLFIGAGGTMTREAAVLGIPTISIYQDKLLDVDEYLIQKGAMIHKMELDVQFVKDFFKKSTKGSPDKLLLEKGSEAYELIKKTLLNNNH